MEDVQMDVQHGHSDRVQSLAPINFTAAIKAVLEVKKVTAGKTQKCGGTEVNWNGGSLSIFIEPIAV